MSFAINTARKVILIAYTTSVLLACLFVPWVGGRVTFSEGGEFPDSEMGFAPIWAPPESSHVDLSCLFMELSLVTALAVLAFLLAGGWKSEQRLTSILRDRREIQEDEETTLRDSFWGRFTLFSQEHQKTKLQRVQRETLERQEAERDRRGAVEEGRRRREQDAARQAQRLKHEKRLKEAGETVFSLFMVSLTLFCVEIVWLLTNHVVDSFWGSVLTFLVFGALFVALAGFYGMTLYMFYCEIEKRFWTPITALNLVLCAANWYLPGAVSHFSITPTPHDLIVWVAFTLFFSCGVFVRLVGK